MKLLDATAEKSCDNCDSQEGRHYCLHHSQQVRNMDIVRCFDWKAKRCRHEERDLDGCCKECGKGL